LPEEPITPFYESQLENNAKDESLNYLSHQYTVYIPWGVAQSYYNHAIDTSELNN